MFSEIKSYIINDILDDIKLLLNLLKKAGLKRVVIVDLTHPDIGIPVVRAIVPGLETLEVGQSFTNTKLFMEEEQKNILKVSNIFKSLPQKLL